MKGYTKFFLNKNIIVFKSHFYYIICWPGAERRDYFFFYFQFDMEEISYCGRVTCKTFYLSRGSWAYPYHSFLAIGVDDNVHFYSAVIVILKDFFRRIIQFLREQTFRILLCVFDINNMIFSKNMFIYFETIKKVPTSLFTKEIVEMWKLILNVLLILSAFCIIQSWYFQ